MTNSQQPPEIGEEVEITKDIVFGHVDVKKGEIVKVEEYFSESNAIKFAVAMGYMVTDDWKKIQEINSVQEAKACSCSMTDLLSRGCQCGGF